MFPYPCHASSGQGENTDRRSYNRVYSYSVFRYSSRRSPFWDSMRPDTLFRRLVLWILMIYLRVGTGLRAGASLVAITFATESRRTLTRLFFISVICTFISFLFGLYTLARYLIESYTSAGGFIIIVLLNECSFRVLMSVIKSFVFFTRVLGRFVAFLT